MSVCNYFDQYKRQKDLIGNIFSIGMLSAALRTAAASIVLAKCIEKVVRTL
jgi:hypothetical protein